MCTMLHWAMCMTMSALTSNWLGRVTAISDHGLCCVALRLLLCGQSGLRGALLLWLLIACELAMRQQPIQHHWQGGACAAWWKETCKATGNKAISSPW